MRELDDARNQNWVLSIVSRPAKIYRILIKLLNVIRTPFKVLKLTFHSAIRLNLIILGVRTQHLSLKLIWTTIPERHTYTHWKISQNISFYVHKNCIKKCIIEPFIIFMYKPGSLKKFISVNKLLFAKALSSFSCCYAVYMLYFLLHTLMRPGLAKKKKINVAVVICLWM